MSFSSYKFCVDCEYEQWGPMFQVAQQTYPLRILGDRMGLV